MNTPPPSPTFTALRRFYELPFVGMCVLAPETRRWQSANNRLCEMLGYAHAELLCVEWPDCVHPDDRDQDAQRYGRMLRGEIQDYQADLRLLRRDGGVIEANIDMRAVRATEGPIESVLATIDDITQRKRAERRVAALGRLYQTLSQVSQAIARTQDETSLYEEICGIFVAHGGVDLAWIGVADFATGRINPVAAVGADHVHVRELDIRLSADDPRGNGPNGVAIRENREVLIEDFAHDPRMASWRASRLGAQFAAAACFPLHRDRKPVATFNVYSRVPGFFDAEIIAQLREIASAISFGLDASAANRHLREANLVTRSLIDATPDTVYVKDLEGNYLLVNSAVERFFGKPAAEVLGRNEAALFDPRDVQHVTAVNREIVASGSARTFEETFTTVEGTTTFLSTKGPLRDTDGRAVGLFGISRDITERKRTEEALRASERLLKSILQLLPVGVWTVNASGRVLSSNPAGERIWGVEHLEEKSQFWRNRAWYLDPRRRIEPHEFASARACSRGETTLEERIEIECLDGSRKVILNSAVPLRSDDGTIIGALVVNQDISERVRFERDLAQRIDELNALNRQLEEAHDQLLQSEKMAAIGQLAAGVAHEINNPVGFVQSNLGTLARYVADLFSVIGAYERVEADATDYAERFAPAAAAKATCDYEYLRGDIIDLLADSRDGVDRMRRIVQDLRDFSRVDTGTWDWSDLHAGLDSTLNIVWNEIKYKAEVIKRYGTLPLVYCLSSQLNQVFMNLLVNAAQAIGERGSITITSGEEDGRVWIDFEDTGRGIAPEHLPRIFEPFFTTKPVGKGTGLGLSLVYSILQRHGGHIDVASTPGRGSRFRVTLPVAGPDLPPALGDNPGLEAA